jgi:hypothetical protein
MGKLTRKGAALPPPSIHDEIEDAALDAAVNAVIKEVLEKLDYSRPISTLTKRDIRRIAVSSISGWIVRRTELSAQSIEQVALELAAKAPIYIDS